MRRFLLLLPLLALPLAGPPAPALAEAGDAAAGAASQPVVEVYKSATCGCCDEWVAHLESEGFRVRSTNVADLAAVKRAHRIPQDAESCHTGVVDGYVIEGHVPAADVARLLRERPENVRGLAVPGMPHGSPGMESPTPQPYAVYTLTEHGLGSVFRRYEKPDAVLREP